MIFGSSDIGKKFYRIKYQCLSGLKKRDSIIFEKNDNYSDVIYVLILPHPSLHSPFLQNLHSLVNVIPDKSRNHQVHDLFIRDKLP